MKLREIFRLSTGLGKPGTTVGNIFGNQGCCFEPQLCDFPRETGLGRDRRGGSRSQSLLGLNGVEQGGGSETKSFPAGR